MPNIPVKGRGDGSGQISQRRAGGTSLPPPPLLLHSLLTLNQVDVSPPELHGAQPLTAVVPQPPQVATGVAPHLAPAAEFASLSQTLRSDNNTRRDTLAVYHTRGPVGMI